MSGHLTAPLGPHGQPQLAARRILGHVDRLGYLYCVECYPVEGSGGLIWSDDGTYLEDECELCHRPLNLGPHG